MSNELIKHTKEKYEKTDLVDIITIMLPAIIVGIIIMSTFRLTSICGQSMENTLYDGQRVLLNIREYKKEAPKYKDIVVIERDDLSVRYLIKRVIGVPGDNLSIKNNKLYINGKLIEESYIKEDMVTDDFEKSIPEGKVFVMGDNRNNSLDSRNDNIIGLIDYKDEILGKAIFNLSKFKHIEN